ncbi:MAG: hypothetical protein QHG98_08680 [Methanothrix sp.]|jgi:hypothetical protein|uniref:hypothetical protein n=1 Tax=Methanothrix sp. TaxID=90426 RepID=UPI00247B35C6|nr:hypothetical protein [Methanothrix sp.]
MNPTVEISMRETKKYGIRRTIFSIWDTENRSITEVEYNHRSRARSCPKCKSESCEHILQARVWWSMEQEAIWRRMDAMYPAEPVRPRVRFAPCLD